MLYGTPPYEVKTMTDRACLVEMILDVPHYKDASINRYERNRLKGYELVAPSIDFAVTISNRILRARKQELQQHVEERKEKTSRSIESVGSF